MHVIAQHAASGVQPCVHRPAYQPMRCLHANWGVGHAGHNCRHAGRCQHWHCMGAVPLSLLRWRPLTHLPCRPVLRCSAWHARPDHAGVPPPLLSSCLSALQLKCATLTCVAERCACCWTHPIFFCGPDGNATCGDQSDACCQGLRTPASVTAPCSASNQH